jgi:gluconolactonase
VASSLGVQVFSPEGKHLGNIPFPEAPSNLTFGGADFKTLYVTASHSVYTASMEVAGARVADPSRKVSGQVGAQ